MVLGLLLLIKTKLIDIVLHFVLFFACIFHRIHKSLLKYALTIACQTNLIRNFAQIIMLTYDSFPR